MIIRSLENPVYSRKRKGGLPGAGPIHKAQYSPKKDTGKSFEDFLQEAFDGEVIQKGAWFSNNITDLTKKNLRKIY